MVKNIVRKSLFFSTVLLLAFTGCKENDGDKSVPDLSDNLYRESVALLKVYSDSIRNAADTMTLQRLSDRCRDRIDALNYHYPPDTYAGMTEGQNDTLSILTHNVVVYRKNRLKYLMSHLPDSTALNSKL